MSSTVAGQQQASLFGGVGCSATCTKSLTLEVNPLLINLLLEPCQLDNPSDPTAFNYFMFMHLLYPSQSFFNDR